MSVVLCGVVALLALLQTVNGLNCYSCNSNNNMACSWGGLTSYTYNNEVCSSGGSFLDTFVNPKCYKITANSKDGREYVARGCISGIVPCSQLATTIGWISAHSSNEGESLQNLNCDTCNTDNCNSAQKVTGVTLIGLIISAAVFLL